MSGVRGFVAGLMGLSLLEVITTNQHGEAGRVGGLFDVTASILSHWLDPYTPLIPDLRDGAANPFGDSIDPSNIVPKDQNPKPKPGGKPGQVQRPAPPEQPGPGGVSSFTNPGKYGITTHRP